MVLLELEGEFELLDWGELCFWIIVLLWLESFKISIDEFDDILELMGSGSSMLGKFDEGVGDISEFIGVDVIILVFLLLGVELL